MLVSAGLGHGTGFMVDGFPGLIVTNAHVIGTAKEVIVQVDSVTSVHANKLLSDEDMDLALLRINEGVCPDCLGLRLAQPRGADPLVTPGEPLVAIGFPLSQKLSITNGIASSIRDGAIISDVNVNPGNSGGPMLNMFGDVVGVNTFAEEGRIGAGVSGAVAVSRLLDLLKKGTAEISAAAVPSAERLPVMPRVRYQVSMLKAIADTAKASAYDSYSPILAQNFIVSVSTPLSFVVRANAGERDVAGGRRERELRAGLSEGESYSMLGDLRDWREYVGDETAPVVGFKIAPRLGYEGEGLDALAKGIGRIFKRGEKVRKEYKGDVSGVTFTRNGKLVRPVQGGHAPQRIATEGSVVDVKDVADFGYYAFLPDVFEPDTAGVPPVIALEIGDLKNQNVPRRVTIAPAVVASLWNDFIPYIRQQTPDRKIRVAIAPVAPGTPTAKDAKGKDSKGKDAISKDTSGKAVKGAAGDTARSAKVPPSGL
ncbi:MAG: S1C family serine protease [Gemmatimonas sp.]